MSHLLGMDDVHLGNVIALHVAESRIVGYLAQGRGEGHRIAAEFCASGIGHILALTGDGKAGEHDKQIGDASTDGADHHDECHGESAATLVTVTAETTPPHAVVDHAHHQRQDSGDDTHEDDARDEQSGVAVADMGQLMADDTSQFLIVQAVEQTCGDRNGI